MTTNTANWRVARTHVPCVGASRRQLVGGGVRRSQSSGAALELCRLTFAVSKRYTMSHGLERPCRQILADRGVLALSLDLSTRRDPQGGKLSFRPIVGALLFRVSSESECAAFDSSRFPVTVTALVRDGTPGLSFLVDWKRGPSHNDRAVHRVHREQRHRPCIAPRAGRPQGRSGCERRSSSRLLN